MEKVASKHYFMVGIGGIGMQALADVLLNMGYKVTGSDINDFPEKDRLEKKGAKIIIGKQVMGNVPDDIDELIYTSAIMQRFPKGDHPEVARAKKLNVKISKRSKLVGELMKDKTSIAVSGTHGKTTTTTLITLILQKANLQPTALIGAEVSSLRGCGLTGTGKYMVVEACEYDRSFLDMNPKIAVLTNIEEDHLDYYKDIKEIRDAFAQFLSLVPQDGLVVAWGDDDNIQKILSNVKSKIITFGLSLNNDLRAENIEYKNGGTRFRLATNNSIFEEINGLELYMELPGEYFVLDALAAIAVAKYLGISGEVIKEVLKQFVRAKRRFEILGKIEGVTFVDDYAHHPTEIQAMLKSTRDYFGKDKKIRVIFQPHQFSRTRLLLGDFAKSFIEADEVLIAPILPVRDSEEDKKSISSEKLADAINQIKDNAQAMDFDDITTHLNNTIKPKDVIISLGAGKNSEWINHFFEEFKR